METLNSSFIISIRMQLQKKLFINELLEQNKHFLKLPKRRIQGLFQKIISYKISSVLEIENYVRLMYLDRI